MGPVGGGFRLKLKACPVKDSTSEGWEIVDGYLDTLTFPGVPLAGTSVADLDARMHAGIRAVRDECQVIEAVIADERAEALHRERERLRGR